MNQQTAAHKLYEEGCIIGDWQGDTYVLVDAWSGIEDKSWFDDAMQAVTGSKYNYVYNDTHATCSECGNIVETSPSSYGWQPNYWIENGSILCGGCVGDDDIIAEEYMQDRISMVMKGEMVGTYLVHPRDYGFVKVVEGLEHGLHEGQNDDPRALASWARERAIECAFTVVSGQFDVRFDVWMRPERSEEDIWDDAPYQTLDDTQIAQIRDALLQDTHWSILRDTFKQIPSPATNCKRQLKAIARGTKHK